ncbi:MAG: NAD(P)/FAD-dependent oxidoreductase [Actinomycetota bacterium]
MDRAETAFDAVVVGAVFAGLYAVHRLATSGLRVQLYEAGEDVGGVWHWNRYPGARCDVESVDYSYSFSEELEQEFEWTERYAPQAEIQEYMRYVATKFDLWPLMEFNARVDSAVYDDATGEWTITLQDGRVSTARYLVLATGPLSIPLTPQIPGLDAFEGAVYHTSRWPEGGVDFTGKRVAVIGTGSSGVQAVPVIAAECEHLTVFQRTANYSIPARNELVSPEYLAEVKANYRARRELARQAKGGSPLRYRTDSALSVDEADRAEAFEKAWARGGTHFTKAFPDIMVDTTVNQMAADFVRGKIRSIVKDPAVAEKLAPKDHPIGAKRLCADTNYYETFNRDNVALVDLKEDPIETIEAEGIRTASGLRPFDAIVLATGFDAVTGSFLAIDIRGSRGASLREAWQAGPRTYLGMAVTGFPNMFLISGPGSPSVLANMVRTAEQQVDWIGDLLVHARERSVARIEAQQAPQDAWVEHVNEAAQGTMFMKANSWYLGANVPGKPRIFMPYAAGLPVYTEECDAVAADGYRGFDLTP